VHSFVCLCAFWYICVPVVCLLSIFLLHLSFYCIVAEIVSFLPSKISGQEFPDSQIWVVDVIFVILTSSTRLEY